MSSIIEYLDSKNINYKQSGDEVIIKCPYCNKDKLYINLRTQLFHCFYCEAKNPQSPYIKGHLTKLQEFWGDIVNLTPLILPEKVKESNEPNFVDLVNRYHYELGKQSRARKYLYKRGITNESIDRFKLGFVRQHGQNWISIPSFENGIPKLIKYRKCPPIENEKLDKYIREKDGKSILFNGDVIDKYNEIIIQEGELDTIMLLQNGYENAVGLTVGAGTLKPSWFEKLVLKEKLILIFDNDPAGQTAARDVWATRLGIDKCYNVVLPKGYDTSEFLLSYNKEELDKLIAKASRFKVDGIYSLSESLYQLYERSQNEDSKKIALPWSSINKLLDGGIEKSWLITVSGLPGVGKTTFCLQILHFLSKQYNIPTLFFCLEMPVFSLAIKVIQLEFGLEFSEILPNDALAYSLNIKNIPMYFGYTPRITPEKFYITAKAARDRYGVGCICFDNIHLMIRSEHESEYGKASAIFKQIAMELNIPMILVAQPRKISGEKEISSTDLKSSSSFHADSDAVLLLHRKRIKTRTSDFSLESTTNIIVDKSRFTSGGRRQLNFIGERSRFEEIR